MGPHVTICNAHGAHNISTAEWTRHRNSFHRSNTSRSISTCSARANGSAASKRPHIMRKSPATHEPHYPPIMHEELTGKRVLLVGYGSIGKEIERMLAPFRVELMRVARTPRTQPKVHAVSRTRRTSSAGRDCDPDPAVHSRIAPSDRCAPVRSHAARDTAGERGARAHRRHRCSCRCTELPAGSAPRSTSPIPSRCPTVTRSGNVPICSSRPTSVDRHRCSRRRAVKIAEDELRRYIAGEPLHNVVQAAI